jgi:hypothetical protein
MVTTFFGGRVPVAAVRGQNGELYLKVRDSSIIRIFAASLY